MTDTTPSLAGSGRLRSWRHALSTVNPPQGAVDPISRWLVITRAGVRR
jgi:1,4-dihydroxy-2-naphthoate octaprenyltransferase